MDASPRQLNRPQPLRRPRMPPLSIRPELSDFLGSDLVGCGGAGGEVRVVVADDERYHGQLGGRARPQPHQQPVRRAERPGYTRPPNAFLAQAQVRLSDSGRYRCWRAGHHNDPDMLEINNSLSEQEGASHYALWAIMKAPLLVGTDLTAASPATLAVLANQVRFNSSLIRH